MNKIIKIFTLVICLLFVGKSFSFADDNHQVYFRKNVIFDEGIPISIPDVVYYTLDSEGIAPNNSDRLYVELWEKIKCDDEKIQHCSVSSQTVTIISNPVKGGMFGDSIALSLYDYVAGLGGGGAENNLSRFYINTFPGIPLELATDSATPNDPNVLELEDAQTLTVSWNRPPYWDAPYWDAGFTPLTPRTAYVYVAPSEAQMLVTNNPNFGQGTGSYTPNKDSIYIQITDSDENKKGYQSDVMGNKVTVSSSLDTETITLTETGNHTGIFRSTGLVLRDTDAGDANNILKVSPTQDTITITYTDSDPPGHFETRTATISTASLLEGFRVSASSTTQKPGIPFALTITALKSDKTTLETYTGTVNLSRNFILPLLGKEDISPQSVSSFKGGQATVQLTYNDSGTITITARDASGSTRSGTSGKITFAP